MRGYDFQIFNGPSVPKYTVLGLDSRIVRSEDVRSVVRFLSEAAVDRMPPTVEDRFLERPLPQEHFHQLRSKGMAVVKHQEKGR